jgi:hypothetical protein
MAQFDGIDEFTQGYIIAALWSTNDDDEQPLDALHSVDDIDSETIAEMVGDCKDFQEANAALLEAYYVHRPADHAGHDFWLTRNGHGTGFWDRGLGKLGDDLAELARVYGEYNLYIGDHGMIYGN